MTCFAVSYDLVKRKDYETLWDEFKRLGGHKALLSLYLVNLNTDDPDVALAHLKQYIDDDDRMIVVRFDQMPGRQKCFEGTKAWLDANL
jgi:hypothetical protein